MSLKHSVLGKLNVLKYSIHGKLNVYNSLCLAARVARAARDGHAAPGEGGDTYRQERKGGLKGRVNTSSLHFLQVRLQLPGGAATLSAGDRWERTRRRAAEVAGGSTCGPSPRSPLPGGKGARRSRTPPYLIQPAEAGRPPHHMV